MTMKILHLCNDLQLSGIVHVAVDLAWAQKSNGHDVGIASAGGRYEELVRSYGIRHFSLDQRRRPPMNIVRALSRLGGIVRTFRPDIVHAHMMTGAVLAYVWRHLQGYNLVTTVHNEFRRDAIVMGLGDRVIAVSRAVADAMAKRGVPRKKIRVVCNGPLGTPRINPIQELSPVPLARPAILTVAGESYRKGVDQVVKAFGTIAGECADAHLYLVGGATPQKFQDLLASTTGAERIHFEGHQDAPQRYMLAADIFVLASRQDPSPLVIPEAREAGAAVIATAVDGIPEALENGEAGLLVPPGDTNALANAMRRLLKDSNELEKWQLKAKANLSWLSVERMNRDTVTIYDELVAHKRELLRSAL